MGIKPPVKSTGTQYSAPVGHILIITKLPRAIATLDFLPNNLWGITLFGSKSICAVAGQLATLSSGDTYAMTEKSAAFCPHFGACGGCKTQNIEYSQQLALKAKALAELFAPLYPGEITVSPSPQTKFYRNKMEFSFVHQVASKNEDGTLVFESAFGLKAAGRWDRAINLSQCGIFSEKAGALIESVRRWAAESGEEFYDLRKHTGSLRQLLVREGKNTGDFLAALYCAKPVKDEAGFIRSVTDVYPQASVLFGINDGLSDIAATNEFKLLSGPGVLSEKILLDGKTLSARISPRSFFQTNTNAATKLYQVARNMAEKLRPQTMFDVYGGAGLFSLACRDFAEKCVCVEISPDSIADGQANAQLNNADITFHTASAEVFLAAPPEEFKNSFCVIDPPRAGLHPKAVKGLLAAPPPQLLYISCNPKALAHDLKALAQNYRIDSIEGFDLFPHTDHVETVAALSRLN